jgi:hypothetical protein
MTTQAVPVALTIGRVFLGVCCALAVAAAVEGHAAPDTPPATSQPAKIRLRAAGRQKVGEAAGFSLVAEVSNPNPKEALTFIGYRPDSFDPPLPKGRIAPLYKIELKRAGKWQAQRIGWCGTGLGAIPLRDTATFGVWIPEGDWEAVRVGLTWTTVAFEKAGEKPGDFTTVWSNELTHQEAQRAK